MPSEGLNLGLIGGNVKAVPLEGRMASRSTPRCRGNNSNGRKGLVSALSIMLVLALCSSWLPKLLANPDAEALRPNGSGTTTELSKSGDDANWKCVDDLGAHDGYATYVYTAPGMSSSRDTYAAQDHAVGTGAINGVTLHYVATKDGSYPTLGASAIIRTHGWIYTGSFYEVTQNWVEYSHTWTVNPYTGSVWTWQEIDDLEIGIDLDCGSQETVDVCCTQVWLVVDYTPNINFAFADGSDTSITTNEKTLTTLSTSSFDAGYNFVIAIVQFSSTANIGLSSLRLTRSGTTLMSSACSIYLGSSAPNSQKWYALMAFDSAPANPTYDVRATAYGSGVSGEAKILAIGGLAGASVQGSPMEISQFETTLATLSTPLPAGDNVVVAILESQNLDSISRTVSSLNLKRTSPAATLASAQYSIRYAAYTTAAGAWQVQLIPYLDAGAPANAQYTVTATSDIANFDIVWGKAKIVAFSTSSLSAAYSDGGSTGLGSSEISINALATTFTTGSDVAVIASEQFDGTHVAQVRTINAGNNKLQQNTQSTGQTENEYAILIPKNNDNDDGKGFGLLNKFTNIPVSPEYETRASASGSANGESKILALAKPPKVPEFPLGPTLVLAVCFTISLIVKRWKA